MNTDPYLKSERFYGNGSIAWRTEWIRSSRDLPAFIGGEQRRMRRLASARHLNLIGWRIRWYGGDATGERTVTMAQWGEVPT